MWRLPGCSPEEFLVARRLAVRTHPVHHKLQSGNMIYNGRFVLQSQFISMHILLEQMINLIVGLFMRLYHVCNRFFQLSPKLA